MTFTDDDLKWLKEHIRDEPVEGTGVWSDANMKALIYRLEAAERIALYAKYYEPLSRLDEVAYNATIMEWHRAAGK